MSLSAHCIRLWRAYEAQLHRRPVPVQMTTSAILWGLGDVFAQRIGEGSPKLEYGRVAATAAFGASFMGPVGHYWYKGLDIWCARIFRQGSPAFLASKVVVDSAVLGPAYILAFYAWGAAFIDGSGVQGFKEKVTKDFVATYCAELCIWPLFQTLNFTRVPVQHQLLAVNVASLLDATFLSWARSQDDWVTTFMVALGVRSLVASKDSGLVSAQGAALELASVPSSVSGRLHPDELVSTQEPVNAPTLVCAQGLVPGHAAGPAGAAAGLAAAAALKRSAAVVG